MLKAAGSLAHTFQEAEAGALVAAMDLPPLTGGGKVRVTATYSGPLARPAQAEHTARLEVTDLHLRAADGAIADDVDLTLLLGNGKGSLSINVATPVGTLTAEAIPFTYDPAEGKLSVGQVDAVVRFTPPRGVGRFWHRRLAGFGGRGTIRLAGSATYDAARDNRWLGSVRLTAEKLDVTAPGERPLLVSDIRWDAVVLTSNRLEIAQLTGNAGGGKITIQAGVDHWAEPDRRKFQVDVVTEDVNLARLAETMVAKPDPRINGRLDLELQLHGSGLGWEGLSGRGKGRLTEADFWSVPVISDVFSRLKLTRAPSVLSEARAVFDLSGPVIGIRRAVVSNRLAGIECTGGTIDVASGWIDVTLVAGTFLTLNRFTGGLGSGIRGKLLGRRVRGKWDELGPKDFLPLPATGMGKGRTKLLGRLARGGGKAGDDVTKALEELYRSLGVKKDGK